MVEFLDLSSWGDPQGAKTKKNGKQSKLQHHKTNNNIIKYESINTHKSKFEKSVKNSRSKIIINRNTRKKTRQLSGLAS